MGSTTVEPVGSTYARPKPLGNLDHRIEQLLGSESVLNESLGYSPNANGIPYTARNLTLEDVDHGKSLTNKDLSLEFWRSHLQTAKPCMLTRLKPGTGSPIPSSRQSVKIDLGGVNTSCRNLFDSTGTSLMTVFKVAWGMVLSTYTGSDHVCFGYGAARPAMSVDGEKTTIKPLIKILPCDMLFEGGTTLLGTVHKAESDFICTIPYQSVSIAEIHHGIGTENGALFNTSIISWPQEDFSDNPMTEVLSQKMTETESLAEYDIIMHVDSKQQCYLSYWDYFLSDEQANHLAGALNVAMISIFESPHRPVGQVELFSYLDQQKLLQWSGQAPIASESCIGDLIGQNCHSRPDSLAVDSWDGSFTYQELDRLSSTLANKLRAAGVGPEVFVTACFDRCKWMPVAMLGIIKAGGAICALDPSYPLGRLTGMCQLLKSTVVLTTANNAQQAEQLELTTIILGSDLWTGDSYDEQERQAPLSNVCPSNALYAVFTSGSTGKPKGVVVEHRSFSSCALASLKPLDIRPHDRVLHFSSYAFDISIFETLATLTAGASVAIPSEKARREDLPGAMRELQATWAFLTPTVARMYQPEDFPSLRTLCLGGEAIHTSDIGLWASKNLITGYNPAESCPLGISGLADQSAASFLGWSFSSQASWIVDPRDYQKLAPIGAVGELLIEGPTVARGYIDDLTCSHPDSPFVLSPPQWLSRFRSSTSQDTRLYRTGDLVQYGSNGSVHFIGRKDLQVKVHGQRVELSEIEFQLHKTLLPLDCKVVVDAVTFTGHTSIIAFITAAEHSDLENEDDADRSPDVKVITQDFEIQAADAATKLQSILPKHMVPTIYLPVGHIPMSRSGKVDRKKLRSLAISLPRETLYCIGRQPGPGEIVATDVERRLQLLFAHVLDLSPEKIKADSDFFRLGGDSIYAMKLLALAPQQGLRHLTYEEIFRHPKLRDLAAASSSLSNISSEIPEDLGPAPFSLARDADSLTKIASEQCGVAVGDIEDIYPCTSLQESLIASTARDQDAYVGVQSFTLNEDIDTTRLKMAWKMTSAGHPILRTRIIQTDSGTPYQAVIRGPLSWSEESSSEDLPPQFKPSIGLGTPLVQLCLTKSRLLVAMHHALYDGWSLPLLLVEVDQAYRQLFVRQLPPFNRYVKHVTETVDSAASFWKAELQDVDPVHFPPLPHLNYKPEPRALLTKLITVTAHTNAQHNVTVATEIQLAWALTSHTYTNSQDVVFGIISSGRGAPVAGIERMLGPTFASTPLRVPIDPAQEVREALEELQYRLAEQTKYVQTGLQRIRQQGPNAAAACSFQTMLVVEPNQPFKTQSAWFSRHEFLSELTRFSSHSLTLRCKLLARSVEVTAIYDQLVVPDAQMQRILSQFQHILTQIQGIGSRNTTIGDINRLSPGDWNELQAWNSTLPPVLELCVHQMIQAKAQMQPEALAIHSWDGALTYKELEDYAKGLAHRLHALGVRPNTFVAIYLQKSLWVVVAQLAVLMAGAAFTTLETSQPINRLRDVCRTVQPTVVLTSDELRLSGADLEVPAPLLVINLQLLLQESGSHSQPFENHTMTASDAMYSIATSGTTGKPKVVVIEHQAFLANSRHLIDRWGFTADSRVLQFAGYSFDAMIVEHFITLLAGGCICIPSSFDRDNRLATCIAEMRVNWAMLTSSVIPLLTPATVPTLQTLVQAGEPMHQGITDCWASHVRLFNAYGPTECSVISTTSNVINPDARNARNIGFTTGGVCWIVDPEHPESPPVPIGAEGELIIEGAILARGYLGDRVRTAAAFTPRPGWLDDFRGSSGDNRVYRTGDIVRYDPDGSISYVRRKDSQVKLRGQRVELLDVEHHLQNCFPGALQVVADIVTVPNTRSSALVALVLATPTSSSSAAIESCPIDDQAMTAHGLLLLANNPQFLIDASAAELALQDRVPSYMVPSLIIPTSHFPRDVSGKVNRGEISRSLAALSRQEWDGYVSTNRVAPTSGLERELQKIWALILNIPPDTIGVHDSFFRLGGDSITCMQVAAQCSRTGIPITVKDVFKRRTIEELAAAAVVVQCPESSTTELVNTAEAKFSFYGPGQLEEYMMQIQPQLGEGQIVEDIYPCSPIQRGILMSHARNSSNYEEVIQWKVISRAPVNVYRLRDAWAQVVDRHAVLRTLFLHVCEENYLDQVVLRSHSPMVLVYNEGEEPVNPVSTGCSQPMHHLRVKRSSTGEITVRLHINHALVDGTSLFIIRRELAMAYEGRLASSRASSPYRDYIAYLQNCHAQIQSKEYWKSYMEGTAPCLFPSLKNAGAQDSQQPFEAFKLQLGATADLNQFCENHRLALTSVLHVVWAMVVQRYTAMDEVCFGYMTSGRHVPVAGVQDIVGPLFNMLVARVGLPHDATLLSVMQKYHDNFLISLDHQHQSLAETLHSVGSASGELFNTLVSIFNDQREGEPAHKSSAVTLVGDDIHSRSEYAITLNVLMLADQVHMQLSYHTSLLSDNYARMIAKTFRHVLATVLGQPQLRLNEIEMLDEEHRSGLYERNHAIVPSYDSCIHYTIHQRCLESPDSPAVCAWDGDFSYSRLDQLSSSLAEELIGHGVGVEMTIPVLLEKTCWTPVAMLAVLKSGASFVLMDASHPLGRLQTICEAINPPVILASPQTRSKAVGLTSHVIEVTNRLLEQEQAEQQQVWPRVGTKGSNAAYVVFTSGSTGKPKGAIVDHSSLATAAEHLPSRMYMNSASRVLQFSSHAWDIPVTDVLLTLRVGGCVCIPSDEERTGNLAQVANRMMVNWALLTPTVARLVKPEDFTHLQTLVLAGEAVSSTDLTTWYDKVRLIQGYGPAECSLVSTVSEPLTPSDNPRNIGQPNGCAAWVVHRDNHHLLAPSGAIGELVLEGPIVSRGYINDPERSAAVFVDPPSWLTTLRGGHSPKRLYKTGDLVSAGLDGCLSFVGRKDDQVKIRGQRVELGEVEALVSQAFPGSHVVVETVKDLSSTILAAFILQKETAHAQPSSISGLLHPPSPLFRELISAASCSLRETMPSFMIPTVFLPLAHLPKAPTGKTDRKFLRGHVASLSRMELEAYSIVDATGRAPLTPLETRLQELVGRVLHRSPESIPLDEDLFTFGLDSLTAMTLATLVREDGLAISVPTIFQRPRLSELAVVLNQEQQIKQGQCQAPPPNALMASMDELCAQWQLDRSQVVNIAPTTYYQRGSLASHHTNFIALHFSQPLDPIAFRNAIVGLVQKHAILRTAFVPFQDTFVQLSLRDFDLPVQEIRTDEDDPSVVAESFCREADRVPVSFGTPITQLYMILGRAGDRLSAVLRLQRAQYDGVAVSCMIADLRSTFDEAPSSAPPTLEYADYVISRRAHSSPSVFQVWRELLQGSSMTYLVPPTEYIRSTDRSRTELLVTSSCDIPMPDTKGGITMATVIKTAWALCLARQTQSQDVVFAQLVRNRHLAIAGIDRTVGPCINYVPVRASLNLDWTAKEFLHWVQRQHIRTMNCDMADWDDLVIESTSWPRDTELGSAVHYLSAPVASDYTFAGDVPCQFQMYDFKMVHTYPMVTCLPFPSVDDSSLKVLKIILTSAVFGQGVADRLLSLFRDMVHRLTTYPESLVSELLIVG
uniref:Lysergyl peptide synthetase subunit 1 n=2 Tax=Epichloe coenophiala TaxID=5047 RepID=S5SWJ3_EPICN|nr:lysergyl peptide synthetase subunit 1 [Epichloe coenophiala]